MVNYPDTSTQKLSPAKRRRVLLALFTIPFVLCGVLAGVGAFNGWRLILFPISAHQQATAQWERAAITDYDLTVRVLLPLRDDSVYELTVVDGDVSEAVRINPGSYRFEADPNRFPVEPSNIERYTLNGLTRIAQRVVTDRPAVVVSPPQGTRITYDATHGFPSLIVENTCPPFVTIEDCISSYEVLAFEPR
ncbi:MAG: hypothetical protein AAF125_11900 [Chloroflexota bacterium]